MRYFCHGVNNNDLNRNYKNKKESNLYYKQHKIDKWYGWKRRNSRSSLSSSSAPAAVHDSRNETKLSYPNQICQSSGNTDGAVNDGQQSQEEEETQTVDSILLNDQNYERIEEVPFEIIEAEDILLWGCPPLKIPRMAFDVEVEKDLFALVVEKAASVPMYRKCKQFLIPSASCTLAFEHWDEFFNGSAWSHHADDDHVKKIILSWSDFNPFVFDFDIENRSRVDSSVYSSSADNFALEPPEKTESDGIYCKMFNVPSANEKTITVIQQQRTYFPTSSSNFESSPIIQQYSSSSAASSQRQAGSKDAQRSEDKSLFSWNDSQAFCRLSKDDSHHLIIPPNNNKIKSPMETQVLYKGHSISVSTNGTRDSDLSSEIRRGQDSLIKSSVTADFNDESTAGQIEEESFYDDDNNNEVMVDKFLNFFNIRMVNSLPTFYTNVQTTVGENNFLHRRRASIAITQQDKEQWEDDQPRIQSTEKKNPSPEEIQVTAGSPKTHNFEVLEVFKFKSREEKQNGHGVKENLDFSQNSLLSFSPKDSFNSSCEGSPMILNILGENFAKSGQDCDYLNDEEWTYDLQGSESMDGENFHNHKFYPPPTPLMGSKKGAYVPVPIRNKKPSEPEPEESDISSRPRVWRKSVLVRGDDTEKNFARKDEEESSEKINVNKKGKMPSPSSRYKKSILKNTKSQESNNQTAFIQENNMSIKQNNNDRTTVISSVDSSSSLSTSTLSYRKGNKQSRKRRKIASKPIRSQLVFRKTRRKSGHNNCGKYSATSPISSFSNFNENFKSRLKHSEHDDNSSSMEDDQEIIKSSSSHNKKKLRLKPKDEDTRPRKYEEDSNNNTNYNISNKSNKNVTSGSSSYSSCSFENNEKPKTSKRPARGKQQLSLWQKMRRYFFGCKSTTQSIENVTNGSFTFENKKRRSPNFCERMVCWWRREAHRRIVVRQDSVQLIRLKRQRLLRELHEFSEDVHQVCKNPRMRDQNDPLRFDTRPKAKVVNSEGCVLLRKQRPLVLIDAENGNKPKEKMESSKPIKGILKNNQNIKKTQKRITYQYD